ncbi:TPA: hypothetical protein DDZ86_02870 [Candidatus Dependentiae bacterium]|nr:MAG: hypothetical protein UW09_C0001G0073 [candidate division TM6 bacterium GW2011_GWF2_43_87]HBL98562.1 hypothetical protein [Candidatus Dependentiae bacterium]
MCYGCVLRVFFLVAQLSASVLLLSMQSEGIVLPKLTFEGVEELGSGTFYRGKIANRKGLWVVMELIKSCEQLNDWFDYANVQRSCQSMDLEGEYVTAQKNKKKQQAFLKKNTALNLLKSAEEKIKEDGSNIQELKKIISDKKVEVEKWTRMFGAGIKKYENGDYDNNGVRYFRYALKTYMQAEFSSLYELWVCYVTDDSDPRPFSIPRFSSYKHPLSKEDVEEGIDPANHIKMFVTVTSNPKALITSHIGVSMSSESTFNSIPGISMDLHSFAAKVMLIRNPARRFMINAPTGVMESIFIRSGIDLFIGRCSDYSFLEKPIQERKQLWKKLKKKYVQDEIEAVAKEKLEFYSHSLKLALANENEQDLAVKKVVNKFKGDEKAEKFLIYKAGKGFKLDNYEIEQATRIARRRAKKACMGPLNEDVSSVLRRAYGYSKQEIEELIKKRPPLIDTSYKNKDIGVEPDLRDGPWEKMIIYEPGSQDKIWLTIDESNKATYSWMLKDCYLAGTETHYLVADLMQMATFGKLAL